VFRVTGDGTGPPLASTAVSHPEPVVVAAVAPDTVKEPWPMFPIVIGITLLLVRAQRDVQRGNAQLRDRRCRYVKGNRDRVIVRGGVRPADDDASRIRPGS